MRPAEKIMPRHSVSHECAQSEAENLLGDFDSLFHQLGSANSDTAAQQLPPGFPQVNGHGLKCFLELYQTKILFPLELPVIAQAHAHAMRGEIREMIALDQRLAKEPSFAPFAAASRRAGGRQMERFRNFRDHRGVQRYLAAVKAGQAQGWHTVVYGLTLAIYSLPLRQGLVHYAGETLGGFTEAAARSRGIAHTDSMIILDGLMGQVPGAVEQAVKGAHLDTVLVGRKEKTSPHPGPLPSI